MEDDISSLGNPGIVAPGFELVQQWGARSTMSGQSFLAGWFWCKEGRPSFLEWWKDSLQVHHVACPDEAQHVG